MARMDFGIGLGAELRFDEIAEHAKVADEGGYTHLTFVDQSNVSRECFGMMTIAAMNTRRIHIGQGVCDPFMYHPGGHRQLHCEPAGAYGRQGVHRPRGGGEGGREGDSRAG